jgi:hypothetical protein
MRMSAPIYHGLSLAMVQALAQKVLGDIAIRIATKR